MTTRKLRPTEGTRPWRLATVLLFALALALPPFAAADDLTTLKQQVRDLQLAVAALVASNIQLRAQVASLQTTSNQLKSQVTALQASDAQQVSQIAALQGGLTTLQNNPLLQLAGKISYNSASNAVVFSGVDVQIVNGLGSTTTYNGTGNLIIGYDEPDVFGVSQQVCSDGSYTTQATCPAPETWGRNQHSGSHNLIIGNNHSYTRFGGMVVGQGNSITKDFASIGGGLGNVAGGTNSTVSGGGYNNASGSVSSVSGGTSNIAGGVWSSISGGYFNTVSGNSASISGGQSNAASGIVSSISGGTNNTATADYTSILGGDYNVASGRWGSVSGGLSNNASGEQSSVTGGNGNTSAGSESVVSGGQGITDSDTLGWAAGSAPGTLSVP